MKNGISNKISKKKNMISGIDRINGIRGMNGIDETSLLAGQAG